jgi:hypothetical protein
VFLFGGQNQPIHGGVEASVIAGLAVGAHIQGAICLVAIALKRSGQIATADVVAANDWFHLVFGSHVQVYRQWKREAEHLLSPVPKAVKIGNRLHIEG